MAKVYLSSTILDLEAEREAVSRWLISSNHQPVHSYVSDSQTVHASCLADIDGCDLFVLILGHRYGFEPEADNPEKLSITHLEFRHAGELGLPRVVLLRTSVPDIQHTDLLDPARNQRLQAFHAEVRQAVRPAEFKNEAELIAALSTGVQRALDKLEENQASGAWQAEAAPASRPGRRSPGWNSRQGTAAGNLPDTPSASGWWSTLPGILTGAAAVIAAITGLVTAFVGQQEKAPSLAQSPPAIAQPVSSASTPATSAPPPARQPAARTLPTVVLDGPRDVSFHKYRPSTYTVLAIDAHPRSPTHFALQFRIRLLTLTSMDMNFWDSSFRLLIDGLPSAPDSNLNELVPGNSAKDGMVSFQVPYDVRSLALRIIHHDSLGDISELPLRLTTSATVDPGIPAANGNQSVRTGSIGAGAKVNIQQKQ